VRRGKDLDRYQENDGNARIIKFTMSYNCLAYVVEDFRKLWKEERDVRTKEIDNINQALGLP
jgi:hypothetical protein